MTDFREWAQSWAATGLAGASKALRASSDALAGMAALLRAGSEWARPEGGERDAADAEPSDATGAAGAAARTAGTHEPAEREREVADIAAQAAGEVVVDEPPTTPTGELRRASAAPSHVAGLAEGTVTEVVRAIDDLSTDELRLLLEHETTHRNRKGVLDAIERALAP